MRLPQPPPENCRSAAAHRQADLLPASRSRRRRANWRARQASVRGRLAEAQRALGREPSAVARAMESQPVAGRPASARRRQECRGMADFRAKRAAVRPAGCPLLLGRPQAAADSDRLPVLPEISPPLRSRLPAHLRPRKGWVTLTQVPPTVARRPVSARELRPALRWGLFLPAVRRPQVRLPAGIAAVRAPATRSEVTRSEVRAQRDGRA